MATAMRGKEKLSDGKETLSYEMFCDGCAVLREEGQGLGKAEWSEALLWHRYEEMRNGVEQIRAEEQRQRNASRGGDARSKGKAKYF